MNFSNIIRKSKEKSLKRSSLLKKSQTKIIKPPAQVKDNTFNKLKTRLMGQKPIEEPEAGRSLIKARLSVAPHPDLDMVRVSM
jgi:hypothetical protein